MDATTPEVEFLEHIIKLIVTEPDQIEISRTVDDLGVLITLKVANMVHLLDDIPPLALSLMRRDPYLDPLNHIQIKLLKRYRDTSLDDEKRKKWLNPLLRSINAIAAGMRNTG